MLGTALRFNKNITHNGNFVNMFTVNVFQTEEQIHFLLQGNVRGVVSFYDIEELERFIAMCQDVVNKIRGVKYPIPDVFLEAFLDT